MVKKILTLLLVALFACTPVYAANNVQDFYGDLQAMGVVPADFNKENAGELITRAEFSHIAAMLLQNEQLALGTTQFTDVGESAYSGAISLLTQMGIVNGVSETEFNPNGLVSAEMAYKIMIHILGYEDFAKSLGGYPVGYQKIATELNFAKYLSFAHDTLTREDALSLADYVLKEGFNDWIYFTENGELEVKTNPKSEFSVLATRHKISVYQAEVKKVTNENGVELKITKNQYDTNPVILEKGDSVSYPYIGGGNAKEYVKAEVTVWVNEAEEIVYLAPRKNCEIRYGFIDSVNGNLTVGASFKADAVDEITFLDDEEEYKVSALEISSNGKLTTSPVKLVGSFVRVVINQNEIVFLETWDFSEGGLISAITAQDITYTKGTQAGIKLKDFDRFKNKRIFIDGKPAAESFVKADTLFDYYSNGDELVMLVSEKKIADTFYSASASEIEIGAAFYRTNGIYYSEDGTKYKSDSNYNVLMDSDICAYVSPGGYVRYIKLATAGEIQRNKFFGIVHGINEYPFREESEIAVWRYGETVTLDVYKINEKTKIVAPLTLEYIKERSKNYYGYGVFEFKVNSEGFVKEIKKPTPFFGYDDPLTPENEATVDITTIDSAGAQAVVNGKRLYFKGADMMAIYKRDGEFYVEKIDVSDLVGRSNFNLNLTFYGDESVKSATPSMVIVTGDIDKVGSVFEQYGIVHSKTTVSQDGNEFVKLKVIKGSGEYTYILTEEYAETIPERAYISYYEGVKYGENEIYVRSFADLTKSASEWEIVTEENANGLHVGTVERLEERRLYVDDTAYYLQSGAQSIPIVSFDAKRKKDIIAIEESEITAGSEVYYYLASSGTVRAIILVE